MSTRKGTVRLSLAVCLSAVLLIGVGCVPSAQPVAPTAASAAAPVQSAAAVTWKMAVNNSPQTNKGEQERVLADLINKKTNGKIKVEIFYDGAIGAERTAMEGTLQKAVQIGLASSANYSAIVPMFAALDLPFLIPNGVDGVAKFMNGPAIKDLQAASEKVGLKTFSFQWEGHRHLWTTKKEVKTPADLKGLKLRTTPSKLEGGYVTGFGANPSVVDFGETYLALKQGVVDGLFIAYSSIVQYKMTDAVRYINEMAVVPIIANYAMNLEEFNKLPAELQQQVLDAGNEATTQAIELGKKADLEFKETVKKEGIKVFEPTAADLKAWMDLAPAVYEKFPEVASKEWMAKAQASAK